MRILFIGDIFGKSGRNLAADLTNRLILKHDIDFVIANGENVAGGKGLTPRLARFLFNSSINVITSGNHIWQKIEIQDFLRENPSLLRPANYPDPAPGEGVVVYEDLHPPIAVINLLGRTYMQAVDCPFAKADQILEALPKSVSTIIVDFHAEATSEKIAMGWHLDGRVSAVLGTHTHVQTADEQILPHGTAYITDVGMTGPHHSIIGVKISRALHRFRTGRPARFEPANQNPILNGVVVEIDNSTGKATHIERLRETP